MLTNAGCHKGSKHWHQDMSLRQHVQVIDREFRTGQPYSEVRQACQRLGVHYRRTGRTTEDNQILGGMNPAAAGAAKLSVDVWPPRSVGIWPPTEFLFYFDDREQLAEIWVKLDRPDHLQREVMALASTGGQETSATLPPNGLWPIGLDNATAATAATFPYARLLPLAPRLGGVGATLTRED